MKKLLFLLLFLPFLGNSQATFTAPVGYNTGAPTATPSGVGTRWRFDLLTGKKYTWLPGSLSWDEDARGIDQVAGCSAPLYTPGYNQSTFAVNSCTPPELYQYTGSAWECLNCVDGLTLTAGAGITLSGTAPDITIENSAPDISISLTEGDGIDITGTYPNFTVTNTSPNVVQTLSIAGQDLTLSGGGGTVAIPAGSSLGIGFTSGGGSGTIPDATVITTGNLDIQSSDNNLRLGDPGLLVNGVGMTISGTIEFGDIYGAREAVYGLVPGDGFIFNPDGITGKQSGVSLNNGYYYTSDYSADIITKPRSIPDVGTVDLLKQTPVSYTSAAAPNNCIFYSTTLSKLAYKDPGGTVNPLY